VGNTDWFSCHFYDGEQGGKPMLGMGHVECGSNGWPVLVPMK
jgi:hypothetical protein